MVVVVVVGGGGGGVVVAMKTLNECRQRQHSGSDRQRPRDQASVVLVD